MLVLTAVFFSFSILLRDEGRRSLSGLSCAVGTAKALSLRLPRRALMRCMRVVMLRVVTLHAFALARNATRPVAKMAALWRCAAPPSPGNQDVLPVMLYLLGGLGPVMGRGVFEYVSQDPGEVGDLYVLLDSARSAAPDFVGVVGRRGCERLKGSIPRMLARPEQKGRAVHHYAAKFLMVKMQVHVFLPRNVSTLLLLDADTCAIAFRQPAARSRVPARRSPGATAGTSCRPAASTSSGSSSPPLSSLARPELT